MVTVVAGGGGGGGGGVVDGPVHAGGEAHPSGKALPPLNLKPDCTPPAWMVVVVTVGWVGGHGGGAGCGRRLRRCARDGRWLRWAWRGRGGGGGGRCLPPPQRGKTLRPSRLRSCVLAGGDVVGVVAGVAMVWWWMRWVLKRWRWWSCVCQCVCACC